MNVTNAGKIKEVEGSGYKCFRIDESGTLKSIYRDFIFQKGQCNLTARGPGFHLFKDEWAALGYLHGAHCDFGAKGYVALKVGYSKFQEATTQFRANMDLSYLRTLGLFQDAHPDTIPIILAKEIYIPLANELIELISPKLEEIVK